MKGPPDWKNPDDLERLFGDSKSIGTALTGKTGGGRSIREIMASKPHYQRHLEKKAEKAKGE